MENLKAASKWAILCIFGSGVLAVAVLVAIRITEASGRSTLSGSIWITDNKGETFLQRGAIVHLLRTRVTSADIRSAAANKIEQIKSLIRTTSDNSGMADELAALESAIGNVKGEVSIYDGRDLLNGERFKRYGQTEIADFSDSASVMSTTADVNAHYEFRNVPSGSYILVAHTRKGALSESVLMNGSPQTVDLH
jgi:hypothetical protein